MSASKIGSNYHLGIKVIFVNLFRAIFFPLFALWMLWKINMSSKKEILEDLARYRSKGDALYKDLYDVSTSALRLMSELEMRLRQNGTEEDLRLIDEINKFAERVMEATIHSNEYATSLLKDYGQALKKIGNS
ncbi:hypothetical protein V6478_000589 [Providencia rettgeri]|uniref:hypothetical protein n=2 Tax=Morganellaceae TaxID=1903414 RepID=UPI0024AAAF28|nr:hypothetical protein [Providencia rettgeri]ELR5064528.1 hypothetical protein [Providencia rettgeri]ELR5163397.1 hypothetical protein [Providencia rettgeri]